MSGSFSGSAAVLSITKEEPTTAVFDATRLAVGVVFTGSGGDELRQTINVEHPPPNKLLTREVLQDTELDKVFDVPLVDPPPPQDRQRNNAEKIDK